MHPEYNKNLHWFAVATAICTFFLVIAGGLVTSTGSALAVPDWPLSYGKLMPPMVGGIFYEHSHRMVATFVGLLTVVLTVWIWRKEKRRWVRILSLIALIAVIMQGLLGGLTVLFLLPTGVSVGHATLAQTFFCIVTSLAFFTSRWWLSDHQPTAETRGDSARPKSSQQTGAPSTFALCVAMTLAVYVQLILGALMRHTGSGLAVPDFPLAYGQVFPALSPESVAAYNERLIQTDVRLAAEGAVTSSQILIHMLHRLWALVVAGAIIWASFRLRKDSVLSKRLSSFSITLILLLSLQVTLGAWTVLSMKAVPITTAHVAVGALLLATCLLVTLHVARLSEVQLFRFSYSVSEKEAIA
jgi:cytochrome c oxidase assembly protein subunit 15